MKWIIKRIFNILYRIKPPESVHYYKKADSARARVKIADDGSLQMEIKGEKYPFAGFPRGHVLMGPLAKLKKTVKDKVFNAVFEEIDKMYKDIDIDALPPEKCAPAVREVNRVLDKMEHMEVTDDMKGRIRLIKKVITFFIQEDDAYRLRLQMFLSMIDQKKVELSKADLYYARGKYWKVDMYKKIGGKWFDGFEY